MDKLTINKTGTSIKISPGIITHVEEKDYSRVIEEECEIELEGSRLLYIKVHRDITNDIRRLFLQKSSDIDKSPIIRISEEEKKDPIILDWFAKINGLLNHSFNDLNLPQVNDMYYFKNTSKLYHYDTYPDPSSYTILLTLKYNCVGGRLVLPEYGIAFPQNDCNIIVFKGSDIIHGASSINNYTDASYRLSFVFYYNKTK